MKRSVEGRKMWRAVKSARCSPGSNCKARSALPCLAFMVPVALTAVAEPLRTPPDRPDQADLREYFECSRSAETGLLGFDEAGRCSRTFLRIKLAFVPDVTLEEFDRMTPAEKAAVNDRGYARYLQWYANNACWLEQLRSGTESTTANATNQGQSRFSKGLTPP